MKVLIANRGEIACRIIRSCRADGHTTVAVYSDADAGALHVESADEAVRLGPAKAAESYLNIPALLEAARQTGANAIHPGYGFLAESARFAAEVESLGMAWIGPRPAEIEAMGDKARSRDIAEAAGVPVLPGSRRFAAGDLDNLAEDGAKVGFPLLVKASGGGGGIGMRVVRSPDELATVAAATQALAERSFGDGAIFLERYVEFARHIEVQVFGDGRGQAIHLFERECSVQRRFQKILEESPAPGLSPRTLAAMTEAAVRLAEEIRYRGAGTVEFVVDGNTQEFFFLEMNTRIQVEHPVTEMITGTDLVGLQLALAADPESFALPQDVARQGHALEVRLCAENPAKMFLPSPGLLETLRFPAASADTRIETGVRAGDRITPHYDSMIAKIIVHAPTRLEAVQRATEALTTLDMGSFVSNRDFLLSVLAHPDFQAGGVGTNFIELRKADLLPQAVAESPFN